MRWEILPMSAVKRSVNHGRASAVPVPPLGRRRPAGSRPGDRGGLAITAAMLHRCRSSGSNVPSWWFAGPGPGANPTYDPEADARHWEALHRLYRAHLRGS
jgi:hypothetical protein